MPSSPSSTFHDFLQTSSYLPFCITPVKMSLTVPGIDYRNASIISIYPMSKEFRRRIFREVLDCPGDVESQGKPN